MSLKDKALKNALAIMNGIGASYQVINHRGEEFVHDPEGVIAKKLNAHKSGLPKRRNLLNPDKPFGAATQFIRQQVEGMEVGELRQVTFGDFEPRTIRSSISSVMLRIYGADGYGVDVKSDKDHADVIRYK